MAEKDTVYETKIKHSGIFNFRDLYGLLYDLLTDMGYFVVEEQYSEKVKAEGKEIEIKWKASRKITDYFKFEIKVGWRILRLVDVEINKGGKKVKANKGDLEIKFAGVLIRDYESKFEVTPFHKFLRAVYEKYIIPNRIEQMEDKIIDDVIGLVNQTKSYLTLEVS